MSSDIIRDENTPHIKGARISYPYPQTLESAQTDKYREYLADKDEPVDTSRNPRNLFHEVNNVDTYWLNVARANLSRSR